MRPSLILRRAVLLCALLLVGCLEGQRGPSAEEQASYASLGFDGQDATGRDAAAWPNLAGTALTVLDHGAFTAFDDAARQFEALTGVEVVHVEADDTGSALSRAMLERGDPSADVLYGLDNVLLLRAQRSGVLQPYTPLLAPRVAPEYVFFEDDPWPATPVDHGYIAINWDPRHASLDGGDGITSLDDVRDHAGLFVTEDPNLSSVGLGFLLATIATYGDADGNAASSGPQAGSPGGWQAYWQDLFDGGVTVTSGWTEAYEQRFSAGYGPSIGGRGDKPIVTSYTQSPAYEHFFGRDESVLAQPLVAPHSTFRQVQTMAILAGTPRLAAAQAWVEFTLTDAFQELAAPGNAVYPVVAGVDANATYGGIDPEPGTFEPADIGFQTAGSHLQAWLAQWTDLCDRNRCR